ncbi:unnamed protein product [Camellia sinensis]
MPAYLINGITQNTTTSHHFKSPTTSSDFRLAFSLSYTGAADPAELAMYKNRLQDYTKKSSIPLPVYETINEGGVLHETRFRSTVQVDGASYTSHYVFSQRNAEEQDVARVALDRVAQKILIRECAADPPELVMYKNRLLEYPKKSSIPLPVYETINEGGVPHEPRFRSTIRVDGASYTSHDVFSQRKVVEQDVARVALDGITQKILIREVCGETVFCKSILHEFPVFCKSILSEYAVKMHLEKPTYNTTRSVGLLPPRVSALVFNSVTYTGEAGKNKKEAEQLAARKVVLSILDTSDSRTVIIEIIKSKVKVNEGDSTQSGINPVAESTAGTIVFVLPAQALEQPLDVGSSSTKKRRKKAKKKSRDDAHCQLLWWLKVKSLLVQFQVAVQCCFE